MNWADPHALFVAPAYVLTALVFVGLAAWAGLRLRAAQRAADHEEGA